MLKKSWDRLLNDLKKAWIPITASVAYIVIMTLVVGEVCPSKIIIGVPCAGCGMVRAFILLLLLRFKEAFIMHPGIYVMLITFIIFMIMRYILNTNVKWIKLLLIISLSLLIIIFVIRILTSFGTEPLILYDKSILFQIAHLFY
ncbi:MAG TPA: DUF2752 domain-containing protein [Clostridia bacterium]|nr:MAG: hypothetical protein BWX97_01654 [Firmicutes bacterium ADurb.Bin146]HOD93337.1 DUF2752 domain-containing protein [Clostridia bacterium]